MKNIAVLAGASALVAALSAPAFAQQEIATGADATGVTAVNEQITDIQDAVRDDFRRSNDADRFGPADRRTGLFGSMALSYNGRTGNSDAQDLGIAGRVSFNQGNFAQSVGLGIEFGENAQGLKDKEKVNAIYDAQYYFNDAAYAFALGRLTVNGLVDGEDELGAPDASELADLRRDGFLGFGPGYRVIANDATAWRVQAGVGVRYTQTGQQFIDDTSSTETGYIASSRFYHKFNDNIFVTNDTDYLSSDANDVATNQFGVNFRVSDQLATKISYTTEYVSDREIRTDNTLGVSLVYGF